MYYVLIQLSGGDIGIVIALALLCGAAQRYGLFGAVLQAADALIALIAEGRSSGYHADIARGAYFGALAAAYALGRVHQEFVRLEAGYHGPALVLKLIDSE